MSEDATSKISEIYESDFERYSDSSSDSSDEEEIPEEPGIVAHDPNLEINYIAPNKAAIKIQSLFRGSLARKKRALNHNTAPATSSYLQKTPVVTICNEKICQSIRLQCEQKGWTTPDYANGQMVMSGEQYEKFKFPSDWYKKVKQTHNTSPSTPADEDYELVQNVPNDSRINWINPRKMTPQPLDDAARMVATAAIRGRKALAPYANEAKKTAKTALNLAHDGASTVMESQHIASALDLAVNFMQKASCTISDASTLAHNAVTSSTSTSVYGFEFVEKPTILEDVLDLTGSQFRNANSFIAASRKKIATAAAIAANIAAGIVNAPSLLREVVRDS